MKKFIITILSTQILGLIGAWVTCVFWGWFIVPQFHVAQLTFRQCMALSICIGLELLGLVVAIACKDKDETETIIFTVGALTYVLVSGAFWKLVLF